MANYVGDWVLDGGLTLMKSASTHVYICNAEPATYTAATSTNALANMNFTAGLVFPASIAAGSPNGRKLVSAAVTSATITTSGTASHQAIVDVPNTRVAAVAALASTQAVTASNPWTLAATDFKLPSQ